MLCLDKMAQFRSSYDQQMQRLFGAENYNAPPWPATSAPEFRTKFDRVLQAVWCPKCGGGIVPHPHPGPHSGPHPHPGPHSGPHPHPGPHSGPHSGPRPGPGPYGSKCDRACRTNSRNQGNKCKSLHLTGDDLMGCCLAAP